MKVFVATNLTDLHREPSFLSEMHLQVFNGMSMGVLEEQEKWCRVRLENGYEGWAHRPFLTTDAAPRPTHIVSAPTTMLLRERAYSLERLTRIPAGTHALVEEEHEQ